MGSDFAVRERPFSMKISFVPRIPQTITHHIISGDIALSAHRIANRGGIDLQKLDSHRTQSQ